MRVDEEGREGVGEEGRERVEREHQGISAHQFSPG